MIPVSLAARPALIAGAVLVALSLLWGGWHYLRAERAEMALFEERAATAAAIAEKLRENAELEAQAKQRIKETTDDYETRLRALRARYDRLRVAAGGSALPAAHASPGGALDAAAGTGDQLPRCVAEDRQAELVSLLQLADTCAERLRACQSAWR